MYARSPTATLGAPVLLSTGKPEARIDETKRETQSFTILAPRFAGNVATVNPPSRAEEVYPQNFIVGQPKNHISDLHFELQPYHGGGRVSKPKCVLVLITLWKESVGLKKSRWLLQWTILRRRDQVLEIVSQTSRSPMQKKRFLPEEDHPKVELQENGLI